MPKSPLCPRCSVTAGVWLYIKQYKTFLALIATSQVERLTEHARGFTCGQKAALSEVIQDLTDLTPYIEIEKQLKMDGKGE